MDCEVEENTFGGSGRTVPLKVIVIEPFLEVLPSIGIKRVIKLWCPDSEDVVNVLFVIEQFVFKFVQYDLFMDGVEDCCICRGWGGTHSCPGELTPVCVPELNDVVFHYDPKGRDDGINREGGPLM